MVTTVTTLTELREILRKHRGRKKVRVLVENGSGTVAIEAGSGVTPGDALMDALHAARFDKTISFTTNGF